MAISNTEKDRIVRLRRNAAYLQARADNPELLPKQRSLAGAGAKAIRWAVAMTIVDIERREKDRIRDHLLDRAINRLRRMKYHRNRPQYDCIEADIRELHLIDVMTHERTFDGQATQAKEDEATKA